MIRKVRSMKISRQDKGDETLIRSKIQGVIIDQFQFYQVLERSLKKKSWSVKISV